MSRQPSPPHRRPAAVFLDKDGSLIDDVPYNVDPALIRLAPGAAQALPALHRAGFRLIVVSNQSGVALGRFPECALIGVRARLEVLLAELGVPLTDFCYCPHHPQGTVTRYRRRCRCRKPAPGMIQVAAQTHGIDLARSWLVGDILDDIEAGRRAGLRTVLLDNGHETEWLPGPHRQPHLRVPDLAGAARAILAAGPLAPRPTPDAPVTHRSTPGSPR